MIPRRALIGALAGLAATPAAVAEPPAPFDAEGRAIAKADARRVIAIGGALTEIVYALGAEASLVAVDTTSQHPPEALKRLPNVGYMRALSAEGVLALRPTLVVAEGDAGPPQALAHLKSAGVAVVLLRRDPTPAGVVYKVRALARLLGREAAGEALAAAFEADMAALAAAIAKAGHQPRVVFLLNAARGLMAAGRDTAADHMIALAGGVNAIQGYTGYKPLSGEAVIAGRPDVILATEHGLANIGGVERLLERPELAATPAGRARRVVAMDALLLLGFGPRTPLAVRSLAAALHPGLALPALKGQAAAR
jgi:iron complex transport system substrate-binding protein